MAGKDGDYQIARHLKNEKTKKPVNKPKINLLFFELFI